MKLSPTRKALAVSVVLLGFGLPALAQEPAAPANPLDASDSHTRRLNVEAGAVMGIIAKPYVMAALVTGPWSLRVSGAAWPANCSGLQINPGVVVRDVGNAKHTIGALWGQFRNACWYTRSGDSWRHSNGGTYYGVAYDFQAKGFFIEAGVAAGARNPVAACLGRGPLTQVYGQLGYVQRFGKKYDD